MACAQLSDFVLLPLFLQPAVDQHGHAIRVVLDYIERMRCKQDGPAAPIESGTEVAF